MYLMIVNLLIVQNLDIQLHEKKKMDCVNQQIQNCSGTIRKDSLC